jgi:hypothetical protein
MCERRRRRVTPSLGQRPGNLLLAEKFVAVVPTTETDSQVLAAASTSTLTGPDRPGMLNREKLFLHANNRYYFY